MTAPSPTPRRMRRPSWLDPRLVVGAVLVLGSVLLGAKLVSSATHSYRFVAFSRDLEAGTVVSAADVELVRAQLPGRGRGIYVTDASSVIGRQLNRAVSRDELVASAALTVETAAMTVTVPLATDAAPPLAQGQRVRLWLSTKTCPSVVVLSDVTVQGVHESSGSSFSAAGGQTVIVTVEPALADRVVAALAQDGATIRAGLLTGPVQPKANDGLPSLACTSAAGGGISAAGGGS